MNMAKKNKRNEKGSITLFVLVAMLFFIIVMALTYTNVANKSLVEMKNIEQIKAEYEKYSNVQAMEQKYEEILDNKELVSLVAYEGAYDGESHTITVIGGNGGTIQYSTDNKTWSTTKPTRIDVGTTTVYVKVVGNSNHDDTTAISSTIKVNPKSVEVKWENKTEFIYNGQAQAPTASVASGVSGETINITRTTGVDVGSYTSTASISSVTGGRAKKENYKLTGDTKEYTIKAYTYTVKYNGNGATEGTTADSTHTYNEEKALTANGYKREYTVTYNHNYTGSTDTTKTVAYTFKNWNTAENGSGTSYANSATVKNLASTNGAIANLYAQWNTASVNYVPTRTGYIFAGWYKEAGCTNKVTDGEYIPTANITLYAKWTTNNYTITYNANSGTGTMETDSIKYNETYTTKANGFSRTGYTFKGWNEKADGTGTDWTSWIGKPWTWTYTRNVTLYAQWTANNYTITYNANGGTGTMETDSIKYNEAYTTKANGFSRTGYIFKGWNEKADGTGTDWTSWIGKPWTWTYTRNVTLYAKWGQNTFDVELTEKTYTYDGTEKKPGVIVKDGEKVLKEGTDYIVTYNNNINAGTATVTVTGKGNYNITQTDTFTITKAENPMTVSNKTIKVGETLDLSTAVSNAQGSLSYAIKSQTTTGSTISNKTLTAGGNSASDDSDKNVVVTITAAGSENYNTASKDVIVTVEKYTRTLAWVDTTPASVTYGDTSKKATVTISGTGGTAGTAGAITYSSSTTGTMTVNSTTGALTPVAAGGSTTITASMARTTTVKAASVTKSISVARAKTATAAATNKTYNGASQTGVSGSNVTWGGTTAGIDAGTYSATATPDANHAWSDGTTVAKTISWTMSAKSVAVTWGGTTTFTFNGAAQAPTASAASGVSGETINVTRTTGTNAGSYTSTASISSVTGGRAKAGNYKLTGNTKAFTINKKAIQKTAGNYSGNYNGSSHTITLAVTEPTSGCTIYYSTSTALTASNYTTSGSTTKPTRTTAGTTTVYWYIHTTNANYSDVTGSNTITINKVAATNPTLTGYSGAYDGSAHTITVSGGSGGTIQYSTDNSTWSTTKPTRTNVGTTTVYVRVAGDSNHNTTSSISATITITRAKTATAAATNKTYNGASQTGVSGSNVTWGGTTTGIDAGTYSATATPDANHAWSDGTTAAKTISWTMSAKSIAVTWGTTTSFTYNGSAQAPTASAASGVSGETINVTRTTGTNAGSYTSTASISSVTGGRAKAGNYKLTGNTKAFTIARAKTATAAAANKTYNGASQTGVSGSNVTWRGTTTGIDAGTYSATATPTGNYAWSDGTTAAKTISWTMSAKSIAVTWGTTTSFTYNGSAQAPTASAASGVSGETINVTRTTGTNAGSYTSTASISSVTGGRAKAGNYKLTGNTKAFTITRAKTATAAAANKTYNGASQTGVSGNYVTWGGSKTGIDAGSYSATATPDANHAWSDGTTAAKTISWTMSPKSVAVTWGTTTSFVYNGTAQAPTASAASGVTGETINVTRTTGTNVGSYTATASISSVTGGRAKASNYKLTGNTKAFTITKKAIQKTAGNYSGNYDGNSHTITLVVTEPTSGCTIYYSASTQLTSSNYTKSGSTAKPTAKTGTTTVYWYIHTTNANYSDVSGSNTITVIDNVAPTVSLSPNGGYVPINNEGYYCSVCKNTYDVEHYHCPTHSSYFSTSSGTCSEVVDRCDGIVTWYSAEYLPNNTCIWGGCGATPAYAARSTCSKCNHRDFAVYCSTHMSERLDLFNSDSYNRTCGNPTYCGEKLINTSELRPAGGTIEVKLTVTDTGGSGLNTLQYAWSTSNTTEPTSWTTFTNGSMVSKTNISSAGTYYLWTNVTDNAGNKATNVKTSKAFLVGIASASDIANSINKSDYYGATVTGYNCTNSAGVDGWKIFYADNKNIYLIASDYIDVSKAPSKTVNGSTYSLNRSGTYRGYFGNIISAYSGSSNITDSRIKALNNDYFTKGYTSTYNNMKAVAYMLDTEAWSGFAGEKAEYAIGGPTVEMLFKSYNQKYTEVDYQAQASSNTGYRISKNAGSSWSNSYTGMLETTDSLYTINSTRKAIGMWLASPSAYSSSYLMYAGYSGDIKYAGYSTSNFGFRPIVCLNSNVKLLKESEGTYSILD